MSETTRRRFTTVERIVAMICITFIALMLIATFGV
jgi:competence protein ComGF